MKFSKTTFDYTKDNELVSLYHLENKNGAFMEILDYGCRVRSICVPDRNGELRDVCLGYPSICDYETDEANLGAAIGRYANRIGQSRFILNEKEYPVDANDGRNHLHGGFKGFHFRMWDAAFEDDKLIFTRSFPDGEDGYPGNLDMKITYEWTDDNCFHITYEGICDQDTILNVTNHTYFNLDGREDGSVLGHELQIPAYFMTENDAESIPTGNILPVENTPFDFRNFKTIGQDIDADHIQLKYGVGYDHNLILDGSGYRKVAIVQSPASGIRLTCYSDQPGIQLYTANYMDTLTGKLGQTTCKRNSLCLETQHYPNSPNIPAFPSVTLKASEPFFSKTSYQFDLME